MQGVVSHGLETGVVNAVREHSPERQLGAQQPVLEPIERLGWRRPCV